jgi:hypothetical protein
MTLDRLKEKFEEFVGFDELGKKILPLEWGGIFLPFFFLLY